MILYFVTKPLECLIQKTNIVEIFHRRISLSDQGARVSCGFKISLLEQPDAFLFFA